MAKEFFKWLAVVVMLLISSIRTVAQGLEPLGEEFVFVGGSIMECYVTTSAAEQARPTDDIDVVLELAHYGKYSAEMPEVIRSKKDAGNIFRHFAEFQGV